MNPALPLDDAGTYVAAAYLVFFALVLLYVAIMAAKLARISRELDELSQLVGARDARRADGADETVGAAPASSQAAGSPAPGRAVPR